MLYSQSDVYISSHNGRHSIWGIIDCLHICLLGPLGVTWQLFHNQFMLDINVNKNGRYASGRAGRDLCALNPVNIIHHKARCTQWSLIPDETFGSINMEVLFFCASRFKLNFVNVIVYCIILWRWEIIIAIFTTLKSHSQNPRSFLTGLFILLPGCQSCTGAQFDQ